MGDLKFVPQSMLDLWADLGKIELEGTTLVIPAESVEFELTPAIRFVSVLEGEDQHKLLAKVKTTTFVKELGGEVLDDSCLVNDTAYQVQPGFLAESQALAAAQTARATRARSRPPTPRSAPAATPSSQASNNPPSTGSNAPAHQSGTDGSVGSDGSEDPTTDADLLSKFLLRHLN